MLWHPPWASPALSAPILARSWQNLRRVMVEVMGEKAVVESLQAWARSGRRFTMLACTYDEIVRRHARLVRWRGTWDHILTCRVSPAADPLDIPSVLWSPDWVLHRIDPERCVGITGREPDRRVLLRETLNEWIRSKSAPGFPSTTLGL